MGTGAHADGSRADVLAVEFKINLLPPSAGERLTGEAFVLKEARTLTVKAAVRTFSGERATLVAMMMQTNMRMRLESEGRFDVKSPKIASHNSVANL